MTFVLIYKIPFSVFYRIYKETLVAEKGKKNLNNTGKKKKRQHQET